MSDMQLHPVVGLDGFDELEVSVEWRRKPGADLELLVWLSGSLARECVPAGGFWATVQLGEPMYVRFAFEAVAFKRALFAAAEVRPVRASQPAPQGVWLLSSAPPRQPSEGAS